MKLGIDIDGCLANFTDSFTKIVTEYTGIQFPKFSDSWPTVWYFDREAGLTKEQESHVWKNIIMAQGSTFWEKLDPLPLAKETLQQLNRLSKEGHDVYFMTNRMGDKAKLQTEKWLYKHGINYPTVILSGNKTPILIGLGIEFFIDDKVETIEEAANAQCVKNLYLLDAAYNRKYNGPYGRVKSIMEGLQKVGLV